MREEGRGGEKEMMMEGWRVEADSRLCAVRGEVEGELKGDAQPPALLAQLGEPTDLTWEGTTDAVFVEVAARRDHPINGVRGLGGGKPALRRAGGVMRRCGERCGEMCGGRRTGYSSL